MPTQTTNDDDCYYRLRTLKITTDDGRSWEIFHWQYLAWGDHGEDFRFFFSILSI